MEYLASSSLVAIGFALAVGFLILLMLYSKEAYFMAKNEKEITDKGLKYTVFEGAESKLFSRFKTRISEFVGDYIPPWWYSPHIGTLFAFGKDLNLVYQTEYLESDDAVFNIDWFPRKPVVENMSNCFNIIVFLPGLGLTSRNKFAQNFANYAANHGYYIAFVGPRGINIQLKTSRFWHPSLYHDTITVLDYINSLYHGHARVFLAGYSAGSNIVQQAILKYNNLLDNNNNVPMTRTRSKKQLQQADRIKISGAFCCCINYDYLLSRNSLEKTLIGSMYSMLLARAYKDIVYRNSHIHDQIPTCNKESLIQMLSSCIFMSDYDYLCSKHIHQFTNEKEMNECLSMHHCDKINIPMLALQPSDDPLHMGRIRENIQLHKIISNPNIYFMETMFGNHFGYFEGSLIDAFSNETSYTYPAKVAVHFFDSVIEEEATRAM